MVSEHGATPSAGNRNHMPGLRDTERVRWHLHGLNTGRIFGLARWGVDRLPAPVSDLIGHGGTWLAFHLARQSTAALIANQRVVVPGLSERERRALALRTYRTYAREVADLFRSLSMDPRQLAAMESPLASPAHLRSAAGGALLVTGHLGNLELGAVLLRGVYGMRLTVVVLPEADPAVNAQRHSMRASAGIETLEVRDPADTALAVRRRLAEGRVVVLVCDRAAGAGQGGGGVLRKTNGFPPVSRPPLLPDGRAARPVVHPAPGGRPLPRVDLRADPGGTGRRSAGERAGGHAAVRIDPRDQGGAVPAPLVPVLPLLGIAQMRRSGHRQIRPCCCARLIRRCKIQCFHARVERFRSRWEWVGRGSKNTS